MQIFVEVNTFVVFLFLEQEELEGGLSAGSAEEWKMPHAPVLRRAGGGTAESGVARGASLRRGFSGGVTRS
jgi:hypothetical protein